MHLLNVTLRQQLAYTGYSVQVYLDSVQMWWANVRIPFKLRLGVFTMPIKSWRIYRAKSKCPVGKLDAEARGVVSRLTRATGLPSDDHLTFTTPSTTSLRTG